MLDLLIPDQFDTTTVYLRLSSGKDANSELKGCIPREGTEGTNYKTLGMEQETGAEHSCLLLLLVFESGNRCNRWIVVFNESADRSARCRRCRCRSNGS